MLNKPAEIKLFNLAFVHPIIQFSGTTCTDCQIKSYSNGTLDFSVNHFSDYNAAEAYCGDRWCMAEISETCLTCALDCGACPPQPACGDQTCNGNETCTSCAQDCGQCQTNNAATTAGATNSDNFCPNPQGLRPCPQANWTSSPNCKWDTTKCGAFELNKTCSPGEKRCFADYLQECKIASPAQWNNTQQCPLGCNPETLNCNTTPQCTENWACTNWGQCTNGIQSRLCKDQNQCQTYKNQPKETQKCATTPTCGDNTCNQGENNTTCPTDCKNTQITGIPTEQLALIALTLLIFTGLVITITHILSARQRA